jgi:iron-sulfur cluster repair protein YtfE (RIC family)/quercetin dioxygenase-like cupin family protein
MSTSSTPARIDDPVAILLDEHRHAEALFATLDHALLVGGAHAREEAVRVLAYLEDGLELHIRKEEEPLFPLLKAALPADDRLIDEMIAEHDQARIVRDTLREQIEEILSGHDHAEMRAQRDAVRAAADAGTPDLSGLRRAWRTLRETLRVHFENEEQIVFPLVPELVSEADRAAAAAAMRAIDAEGRRPTAAPERVAAVHVADPAALVTELLASAEVAREGRTARTLVKKGPLRVVLVALRAGGQLREHHVPGAVCIQVLRGAARITTADAGYDLPAGGFVVLPHGRRHSAEARTDTGLLLTFNAPA